MKNSRRLAMALLILCMTIPVPAGDSESKSSDGAKKELKRMAHRLRIPVSQMENARSALQEATNLAIAMDPFPASKINTILSEWNTLQPSRVESTSEYFILTLELQALEAADETAYSQANSYATAILRTLASVNYSKAKEILSTWPYPLESFGESAIQSYDRMQSSVMQSILQQMAKKDPDALKKQSVNYDDTSPSDLLSIAQNLANSGNRDKARELLDKAIEDLPENNNSPSNTALAFTWSQAARYMDNAQVEKLLDRVVPMMEASPVNRVNLTTTVSRGDVELELSPSETGLLSILRGLTSRPRLLNKMLDKYPELEARFDSFGGIDDYLSNGSFARDFVRYQSDLVVGTTPLSTLTGYDSNDSRDLTDKLKDRAADEPQWVKQELRKSIKDPVNINMLTSIASNSSREYPELAEIALELAEELLPEIDDLQKRFSALQSIISGYKNLDGEVDEELFRKGYILIDRIKENPSPNIGNLTPQLSAALAAVNSNTERLEAYLVAELSRQDYDKAIDFVHAMTPGPAQLECLIQISRALRQNNF